MPALCQVSTNVFSKNCEKTNFKTITVDPVVANSIIFIDISVTISHNNLMCINW